MTQTVSTCSKCQGHLRQRLGSALSFWCRCGSGLGLRCVCSTFPGAAGAAGLCRAGRSHSEHPRDSMTCPGLHPKVWEDSLALGFWSHVSDFQDRKLAPGVHVSSLLAHKDWGPGFRLGFPFLCLHRIGAFSLNSRTGKPMPAVSNG